MTRVLWVSSEPPDFSVGGGAIRQAHLLRGLAERFERVDLVLAGQLDDDEVRGLLGQITEVDTPVVAAPASVLRRRLGDLWKTFALRQPAEVHDRRVDRRTLERALASLASTPDIRGGPPGPPYDVIQVEHLGLAGIVPARLPGLRSLDVQNVPSRMAAQTLALEVGRRQRLLRRGELAAARRFELRARGTADLLSVVSPEDAADLGGGQRAGSLAGAPRVVVVPNGVELARFPAAGLAREPRLVFTGTLDFLPNTEGIEWFVDHVLPLVHAEVPEATLDIVGRRPTVGVRALARRPGVRLHSDVADVVPLLAAARVAVVPVRIGSGSRLKVLEAMATARPVVSTTIGAEGLSISPGAQALVVDDPREMAAAVVGVCRDDELAAGLGRAGRRLVEERYRWDRIAADYASALAGALEERGGQSA